MATRRSQRTGAEYRACARAYQRRLRYLKWLHADEREPSRPASTNRRIEAMEVDPEDVQDPLEGYASDGEEIARNFSSDEGDDLSDIEDLFELDIPERPYGDGLSLKDSLRLWVLQTGQKRKATNMLLAILRQHHPEHNLPKNKRSLLGTPVSIGRKKSDVGEGHQCVQGIAASLRSYYRNYQPAVDDLDLDFFVFGLPQHDSRRIEFWPILMKVRNVPDTPVMTVSIFGGSAKPSSAEAYLRPFVTEMNRLQEEGITIGSRHYPVNFSCLITDNPARSFAKGVAHHNSSDGCGRCMIVGKRKMNRMRFPYTVPIPENRTDEQFRAGAYAGHIKFATPLIDLDNCDMVLDVLTSESRQLLHKGIMYGLLRFWTHSVAGMRKMLNDEQQHKMSAHWQSLQLPSEFRQRPRDLECLKNWKAAELKMFLEVGGPVVLKGVLPNAAYQHFMLLFVAVRILSSYRYRAHWVWADGLLYKFVEDYADIFHPYLMTSNVHNLLHVHGDVARFRELPTISADPFEEKRKEIVELLQSGRYSLAQAAHRLRELQQVQVATSPHDPAKYRTVRQLGEETITMVRRDVMLRKNFRDQWFLTTTGQVVQYVTGIKTKEQLEVQGYLFTKQVPAFSYPYRSEELDMYSANLGDLDEGTLHLFPAEQVLCKVAAVQFGDGMDMWFIPLSHTFLPHLEATKPSGTISPTALAEQ